MVKTFDVLLDIEKELYNPSSLLFTVSRDDFNTVQLNFAITQDGKTVDLTNKIVELAVKKPSGLTVYQDCEITNALEGLAQIYLSQQAYIEYGIYMAEVYVREGTEISVTCPFWYQAKASIFNAYGMGSSDDWSALQKALFAYDLKPILVEGFPTITPEYVGQMAFDTVNEIAYIATDLSSADWRTFGTGEGGGGGNDTIFGDNPLNFIPARIGQIFIDEINEDAYIAIGLTVNDWEQINNEEVIKQAITWAEILNKPTTFAPEEHGHIIAEVLGLQAELDSKADAGSETIVEDNLISNSTSSALSANQGRILDETKADSIHTHVWADITDAPETFAPETHGHLISEVENLQTELDGKADLIHDHVISDVTGLQEVLNSKADDIHNHVISDVTGLQGALDLKADDTDLAGKADINHNHDTAYLSKTGGEITDRLIINNKGDGKEQIRFDIDRAWTFKQIGADTSTQLALIPDANNKTFSIMSPLGIKTLEIRVSDIAEDGYINAPIIQENGVKLADKFALKSAIWTGTQAEYDAISPKDATTLYFITG